MILIFTGISDGSISMKLWRFTHAMILILVVSATSSLFAAEGRKVTPGVDNLTGGIPGSGPLTDEEIATWLNNPAHHDVLDL
ncbi:MAG: hypothetical protein ACK58T_50005, partial [Phycisphaerae bacterium]